MVTINVYDNAAKQSENAVQTTETAEAPMPQGTSLTQESLSSFAPQPESIQVNSETSFTDKAPSPDLLSGLPLTESDSFISEQTFLQNFTNSSAPSPGMQADVSASAETSGPAPSMQADKMHNDQADAPAPSLEPGDGEKGSKEEQSKKK